MPRRRKKTASTNVNQKSKKKPVESSHISTEYPFSEKIMAVFVCIVCLGWISIGVYNVKVAKERMSEIDWEIGGDEEEEKKLDKEYDNIVFQWDRGTFMCATGWVIILIVIFSVTLYMLNIRGLLSLGWYGWFMLGLVVFMLFTTASMVFYNYTRKEELEHFIVE